MLYKEVQIESSIKMQSLNKDEFYLSNVEITIIRLL